MAKELTWSISVEVDDKLVPFEDCNLDELKPIWQKRLSETLSDYYSSHPDEYSAV